MLTLGILAVVGLAGEGCSGDDRASIDAGAPAVPPPRISGASTGIGARGEHYSCGATFTSTPAGDSATFDFSVRSQGIHTLVYHYAYGTDPTGALSSGQFTSTTTIQKAIFTNVVTTVTSATAFHTHVDYGAAFQGAQSADLDTVVTPTSSETVTGNFDGRAIVPLSLGPHPTAADESNVTFADGQPPPVVAVAQDDRVLAGHLNNDAQADLPLCAATLGAAAPALRLINDSLTIPGLPGHHTNAAATASCDTCRTNADKNFELCFAGTASVGTGACLLATLGFGTALCVAVADLAAGAICDSQVLAPQTTACNTPPGQCCPVGCGASCCDADETCLDSTLQLCCSNGNAPCDGLSCCPAGDTCLVGSGGFCCPVGNKQCGTPGTCCAANETACTSNTNLCCAPANLCGSECCNTPGSVCAGPAA